MSVSVAGRILDEVQIDTEGLQQWDKSPDASLNLFWV